MAAARRRLARVPRPGQAPTADARLETDARLRADTEPGTDALPQIQHIVILMMENHSYDNYLGMLAGRGDGFALAPDGKPTGACTAGDGSTVPLWTSSQTTQEQGVPTQTWHASHLQFDGGSCEGFVRSIEQTLPGADGRASMRYWTEAELPFYYGLARTFPLATRWFSSCLGPTFPNRRFLIAGTANGLIDDLAFGMIDYPANGTIFDHLSAHGISWANYHHLPPGKLRFRRSGARGRAAVCAPAGWSDSGNLPVAAIDDREQAAGNGRPVPARAPALAESLAADGRLLDRRRGRDPALGQHRGPGLPRQLRGEPAGHRRRRGPRRAGHQRRDGRPRLAGHAADLAV